MSVHMKSRLSHIILLLVIVLTMPTACYGQFFSSAQAPNPTVFLPAIINDENNPHWARDMYIHFQSKSLRDSAYIDEMKLATYDYRSTNETVLQGYYANNTVRFFQPAFGLQVNASVNRDIFLFLDSCRRSSSYMIKKIPDSWYRLRPCVRLREACFGMIRSSSNYAANYAAAPCYSFPSHFGTAGWLTGMIMSCVNPWHADTILTRAYRLGLYNVISGGAWSSDVDLTRQLGTIAFAQLMTIPRFRSRLATLRQQTSQLLNIDRNSSTIDQLLSNDTLTHKLSALLPAIQGESDGSFQSDLSRYLALSPLRDSLAANDLLGASYMDIENPMDAFQPVVQLAISPEYTPCIYELLSLVESCCDLLCEQVKSQTTFHRRPFDVFNTAPFTLEDPEELRQLNSYPSMHASKGLATALALSMIVPERRDTLLQAGFQYGLNRVICGTNWHSDVEAGRVVGCLAVSLVASGSDFIDLLEDAQNEYRLIQDVIITDTPSIEADPSHADPPLFTIDGRRATPQSRGVLVGHGKKIIKP